ncbi:glycogen synthase GlgA [Rhodobaculum claviforme]|uniref:Glycogen synthase n=1 Tax=Rhodobaculum claviforme TaxID=1549854 RepID=A0A934TGD0_9RHOB|nr:glycogen synthase GlgA [Rhodobaculum claviforme]MBK5926074.1 starch synthase [Rhodobaculum claviforme]
MRAVLAVASECAPLIKTGGLADVVGALPAALAPLGWGVRVLLPGYPAVLRALAQGGPAGATADGPDAVAREGALYDVVAREDDLYGGPARVLAARVGALDLLVLDAPHLFDRPGTPYLDAEGRDWADNDLRFAGLSWMAARIAAGAMEGWRPEVVHLHDWQAALAAVYAREMGARAGTLMTVHNIAFHGLAPGARRGALRLPEAGFHPGGYEFFGHVSALKAGLVWADRISTVSPTYAHELTSPDFGMGLDGVIRARADVLTGILNGVDTEVWDPATDPHIRPFRTARGKAANRARLLSAFGLEDGPGPLCIVVSRLTEQKGLDLLLEALPALTGRGGRLALLGTGERALENAWLSVAGRNRSVAVRIGYDETLAHRMFAGADAVLVPSRFEPCGLTQMYGLRYGAIPVVGMTGGLADTVIHASEAALRAGVATGLQVFPIDAHALAHALARLCDLHARPDIWARLQRNAMRSPVGWDASAPRYAALYDDLAAGA